MSIRFSKPPAVRVVKPVYTMASVDGQSAEITLYGDIYESQPVDPWTGEPLEGQFILLNEFLADLQEVEGCKDITVRINSYGGDAGVSNTIHNRLRELARGGAALTCIVDGVAMSGGSLIMCAADTVKANPSSLIMIHKCWTMMLGGYNADELRQAAEQNDTWDKMQVECYKRKTGLSDTVLMHMMADTTYMTGREAKDKGFVDELLEDEPAKIAASADRRVLFVCGRMMHLAPGMIAPESIPIATPEAQAADDANNTPVVTGKEGGHPMTIEELRAQYPDEIAKVEAQARAGVDTTEAVIAAVQAERERLRAIDEVAGLFDRELVNAAKYGDHPMTAAEMTLAAAKAAAKSGSKFLADALEDAARSGTARVGALPAQEDKPKTPEAKLNEARAAVQALFEKEGTV